MTQKFMTQKFIPLKHYPSDNHYVITLNGIIYENNSHIDEVHNRKLRLTLSVYSSCIFVAAQLPKCNPSVKYLSVYLTLDDSLSNFAKLDFGLNIIR